MEFKLSARQIEIIKRQIKGETERLIAYNLGISLYTVKYHKREMFKKLNVNNIASAVSKLKEAGMI